MDSSPILRQQNQNKFRCDFQRMKNEHNKKQGEPKLSKRLPPTCLSDKDRENKDPAESCRRAPLQPAVSKLPVLAKSLRLQTPSDFSQSHLRWEEKPLSGKAKKKKPCTRPVPFNLSQPKNTKMVAENQQPIPTPQSRTRATKPENKHCNAKPPKHQAVLSSKVDSTKIVGKSHGNTPLKMSHLSGQSGPPNTSKTLSHPLSSSVPSDTMHQNKATSYVQPAVNAEICLNNMNLLSLKDVSKTSNAGQTAQLTTQGNPSNASNGENFQQDHAALLSILRNEGVGFAGRVSATPKSKAYNHLPLRVSTMKKNQIAGSSIVKSSQFSPDPAALQSILLNEGVKDRGPVGATTRNSVCPPGRGTSIYMARRVPVTKKCAETTGGPVAALKETPLKKWTPQRVPNTKLQPMSAMKWHQLTQQSLYCTPRARSCKSNPRPHQEEVVQRLFDDPKDEQTMNVVDKAPENKPPCEVKLETSKTNSEEEEEEEEQEMFLQAPPRESVIFFSTGKKLLRVPRFENLESSAQQNQHGPVSSDMGKVPTAHDEISAESGLIHQINPSVKHLHRDLVAPKSYSNPAVAMLRKRLPPLEELRMDEEVATYTSATVPAAPGFVPPRPRCGNPLASILHFEESTRFLPIDLDLSSSPLHGSPLHER